MLPWLKDSGVASPDDLIIANMGLHHGQVSTRASGLHRSAPRVTSACVPAAAPQALGRALGLAAAQPGPWFPPRSPAPPPSPCCLAPRQELGKLSAAFAAYVARHRAALPRALWQQTSAQHFKTDAGEWPGGEAPFECAPLAGDAFEVKVRRELTWSGCGRRWWSEVDAAAAARRLTECHPGRPARLPAHLSASCSPRPALQGDGQLALRAGREDKFGLLQGGWRNRLCDPHMHAAGIPVIQARPLLLCRTCSAGLLISSAVPARSRGAQRCRCRPSPAAPPAAVVSGSRINPRRPPRTSQTSLAVLERVGGDVGGS